MKQLFFWNVCASPQIKMVAFQTCLTASNHINFEFSNMNQNNSIMSFSMLILTSVGLNFVIIFNSQTLSIKLLTNITNNLYDFRDTAILENELFTPTDYF